MLAGLLSLPLILSLLAAWISARASWPLALLTIGFPWIYAATVLLLIPLRRRTLGWLPVLPLLLGLVHLPSFFGWHHQRRGDFRILSMNCRYFDALSQGRAIVHNNIEASKDWLRPVKPDLVCSQDFSTSHQAENDQIENFVKAQFGLEQFIYYLPSMALYSRSPITSHRGLIFPSTYNAYCAADVELGGRPVRVYNLHLQSYQLGGLRSAWGKLREGIQLRSEQAELVAKDIAACPRPVIVCGDFNDVPTSYAYRKVLGSLQDGFRQAGRGTGFTYQGGLPGLRIDYVMCSRELEFAGYQQLKGPDFLDHRWIVADLRWK